MKIEIVKNSNGKDEKVVTISESEFMEISKTAFSNLCDRDVKMLKDHNEKVDPTLMLMNAFVSTQLSAEYNNLMFTDKTEETNESEDKE